MLAGTPAILYVHYVPITTKTPAVKLINARCSSSLPPRLLLPVLSEQHLLASRGQDRNAVFRYTCSPCVPRPLSHPTSTQGANSTQLTYKLATDSEHLSILIAAAFVQTTTLSYLNSSHSLAPSKVPLPCSSHFSKTPTRWSFCTQLLRGSQAYETQFGPLNGPPVSFPNPHALHFKPNRIVCCLVLCCTLPSCSVS